LELYLHSPVRFKAEEQLYIYLTLYVFFSGVTDFAAHAAVRNILSTLQLNETYEMKKFINYYTIK